MKYSENTVDTLIAAVECSQALDMPFNEGLAVMENHGFDHGNRFSLTASEFVKEKQNEALEMVKNEA